MGSSEAILKKLRIVSDLFEMAMKIKSQQLRRQHPEATEDQIRAMALELVEKGCR